MLILAFSCCPFRCPPHGSPRTAGVSGLQPVDAVSELELHITLKALPSNSVIPTHQQLQFPRLSFRNHSDPSSPCDPSSPIALTPWNKYCPRKYTPCGKAQELRVERFLARKNIVDVGYVCAECNERLGAETAMPTPRSRYMTIRAKSGANCMISFP